LALSALLASKVQQVLLARLVQKAQSVKKATLALLAYRVKLGQLGNLVQLDSLGSMVSLELLDFQDRLATQVIRVLVVHRVQLDLLEQPEALDQPAPLEKLVQKVVLDHKETLVILVILDLTDDKASLA